jgi:hypothetical protein
MGTDGKFPLSEATNHYEPNDSIIRYQKTSRLSPVSPSKPKVVLGR